MNNKNKHIAITHKLPIIVCNFKNRIYICHNIPTLELKKSMKGSKKYTIQRKIKKDYSSAFVLLTGTLKNFSEKELQSIPAI